MYNGKKFTSLIYCTQLYISKTLCKMGYKMCLWCNLQQGKESIQNLHWLKVKRWRKKKFYSTQKMGYYYTFLCFIAFHISSKTGTSLHLHISHKHLTEVASRRRTRESCHTKGGKTQLLQLSWSSAGPSSCSYFNEVRQWQKIYTW